MNQGAKAADTDRIDPAASSFRPRLTALALDSPTVAEPEGHLIPGVEPPGSEAVPDVEPYPLRGFWSRTALRTQRGLLVAGSLCLFVLLIVMVSRPRPAGPPDAAPDIDAPVLTETENAISAKLLGPEPQPEPEPEAFGASSKVGELPPTTLPETTAETAAVAEPAPEVTAAAAPQAQAQAAVPAIVSQGRVHEVASPEQWTSALAAAQPGDVIKLVATIRQPLAYRGGSYQPDKRNAPDGTADRPITITAADGVWIEPGNKSNSKPGLDILYTSHVHVIGVRVRNSQFGIRVLGSSGTVQSPIVVAGNTVTDLGHAGIHVGANIETRQPSRHVRIEGNTITRMGQTQPQFGEGIYLGYGTREWIDETSDVQVIGNTISHVTAEGVDIKPGVRRVLVENNRIHDLSPLAGGAISASYVGTAPNPKMSESIDVVIRGNRIWNVNLDGRSGSNDWAIWVGHGGVTVEGNTIWGLRGNPGQTRAVRIRATYDFGPHPIRIINNTFWTAAGWMAEGTPSGARLIQASGNRGPAGASGIEVTMGPRGGVPAIGSGGTADAGSGPGSALN